ncbi:hypothetical protein BDA99DRAFT_533164 [Phascolomyces articulosus]|uniref:Uncharacterized protein n=1 Tax=Phascolomyces articulosus TaxID=60185 RepID=A0AAD5KKZ5_9FUNG|nr:hypothetical protein BDA99DRAFT_533164 [Phascolomyces articulosus]
MSINMEEDGLLLFQKRIEAKLLYDHKILLNVTGIDALAIVCIKLYDLDSLTDKHMSQGPYHPKKQADLYWAHNSVAEALNLFHYQWLPIDKRATEADVIRRVFPFIEKCFDDRKDTGHIFDVIISHLDFEYGCAEGGSTSLKWINEANIKPNTAAINDVTVPELAINGLDMMVEMITIPKHYVCILNKYGPISFPDKTKSFYKHSMPSLILTCDITPCHTHEKIVRTRIIDQDEIHTISVLNKHQDIGYKEKSESFDYKKTKEMTHKP